MPMDTGDVSIHRFQYLWGFREPMPHGYQGQLSFGGVKSYMWIFFFVCGFLAGVIGTSNSQVVQGSAVL